MDPVVVNCSAPGVLPGIVSAGAGLLGVCVGGAITWVRESLKDSKSSRKELLLLAILVSAHLDRLADECAAVAYDDGTYQGLPSGDDGMTYEPVVEHPKFDPLSLEVEWRVLPPSLMQEILSLPHRLEKLKKKLGDIAEFDSGPDYDAYFDARQYDFTVLGLEVLALINKLRAHAKLIDEPKIEGEWDMNAALSEHQEKMDTQRAARDEAHARSMRDLEALRLTCTEQKPSI